jgi:hypothetical protein
MADEKKEKKASRPLSVKLAFFVMFIMGLLFLPVTMVLIVCMIPTLVAAMVDANKQKTAWLTIGAPNLAGSLPVIFHLWDLGPSLSNAMSLATDVSVLLPPLMGAGVGWIIHNYVTSAVAGMMTHKNEIRLREIDKRQKELIRKWGSDVAKG